MRIVDFRPFPDEPGFREALLELADEVLPGNLQRTVPTSAEAPVAIGLSSGLTEDELRAQAGLVKDDLEGALGAAFAVEFSISADDRTV
ncbi:MAG: hypothetical protein JHD16_10575 [Solirubrobacteraceae bacterium]|nr:hypothetical protein [Solirubrobacteraceae bacterium]